MILGRVAFAMLVISPLFVGSTSAPASGTWPAAQPLPAAVRVAGPRPAAPLAVSAVPPLPLSIPPTRPLQPAPTASGP